ncbi:integrase, catalytic region, zinc finger, CCHC-type containing protein [Tanacetum coccineum]
MLSSTGVKPSTSASGSQPLGNTKKDKIQQTPSSTQKNKHSKLNANFELLCVKGNGCMLSDNHDLCVLDFINNVNARAKPKSIKKSSKRKVVQIVLWYLDSGCSKQMTEDCSQLTNFVNKFFGTVKFGNDHVAKILGYGDYHIRNVTILRVYYVEGLGHNLFSVGQLCDSNLKVAFRQHTCFIRNLEGVDLLTGSRGNNLYTLSLQEMMVYSPMSQVLIERSTSSSLSMITLDLHGTDNGTKFVNQTLREYYKKVGISHETSVARSPQQNGVVERRNRTQIEVARTMLIYAKAPLFLWAEPVAIACYTQNHSIKRLHSRQNTI